jgi:hypothetical protein
MLNADTTFNITSSYMCGGSAHEILQICGEQLAHRIHNAVLIAQAERLRIESQEAAEAGQWSYAASLAINALNLWRGSPLEDVPSAALDRARLARPEDLRVELMTRPFRCGASPRRGRVSDRGTPAASRPGPHA